MSNDKDSEEVPRRKVQTITVYQFNDEIGDFEELIIYPDLKLEDLLDDDFILLFVDPQHNRVWMWHGYNTTTRMKFIAAKTAPSIRDKHGIAFKLTTVDQDDETHGFKVMLGLEQEIDYDQIQTGPEYEGTTEDLEFLKSMSREKILLRLEKAGIPEGFKRKIVIVKNQIFGYREYDRNYLGSVIKEKQLFPLKEEIEDGTYLADKYIPRMHFSYNNVVLTELLEPVEIDDSIQKKSIKDLDA
ncbi:MAG: hypothetical protein KGD72_09135 [Candidatus Lokiarchaeota archaeon]|nr:hypothetical protein [Candidatus Lokiarchaeota archaeon]